MSANVFAFPGRDKGPQPWTNEELAELYRVVDLLGRAGLSVATDMGMSDEGDPWFVFCRVDNEEVIAHFARIDGVFVAASIAVDETFRGANFRQIVDRMVSSQPLVMPRPTNGSRLLLHPAVLLTAFVATALAHSEKAQALDWLRAVEAQWDHGKAALINEVKHIKTGWFDTLQSLLKMPLHENKLAHDSSKEAQSLTLVSLIAIAMSALQPIVEKIAVISQFVSDELQSREGNAGQGHSHAIQLTQDDSGSGIAGAVVAGHDGSHAHSGADDAPQTHKIVPSAAGDAAGSDGQKAMIDSSAVAHAVATVPAVQKVAFATDDAWHVAVAPVEAQAEALGTFILVQQKAAAVAATATAQAETLTFVAVSTNATPLSIGVDDVTNQAKSALFNGKGDGSGSGSSGSSGSTDSSSSHSGTDPSSSDSSSSSNVVTTTPQTPVNQVVDAVHVSMSSGIQAISNFVNDETHVVTDAAALTVNQTLQTKLSSFFGNSGSLTVVFFDSNSSSVPDVFLFSTGVVFIEEKDIASNLHVTNTGGTLTLDVDTQGGTVTLVGVATIEHTAAA